MRPISWGCAAGPSSRSRDEVHWSEQMLPSNCEWYMLCMTSWTNILAVLEGLNCVDVSRCC